MFDFIFKAIGAVIGLGQAVVETPLWVIGGSRGENPIERGYATYESFVRIGDDINKSIFGGADAGRDQSLRNIQQPKIRNNGAITIGVNDYDLYQYEENYYTNENGTKSGG